MIDENELLCGRAAAILGQLGQSGIEMAHGWLEPACRRRDDLDLAITDLTTPDAEKTHPELPIRILREYGFLDEHRVFDGNS